MKGNTVMQLHFRDAAVNLTNELKNNFAVLTADPAVLDRNVKARIGTNIAAIPAVILSVKAMREFGFKDSFRIGNTFSMMRNNKISSAIYLAGLGYASYQTAMKIREAIEESKQGSYDLGATDTELWAAHLAEGDVTIFDRLVKVREEALALVKANGLELKPNADSPYFDVKLAREELATMSQQELEELETVLNRRIMAIVEGGEEHDDEEAFLHASLVILEEVLDERYLYAGPIDQSREQAKERHPSASQHDTRTKSFNTGASTTVEDLLHKVEVNYAIQNMDKVMPDLQTGDPVYLIEVDRYGTGDSIGLHLVQKSAEGNRFSHINRVLGLYSAAQAQDAVNHFEAVQGDFSPAMKVTEVYEELRTYIRAQIIPLEWKSMSDDELDERIKVNFGHTES